MNAFKETYQENLSTETLVKKIIYSKECKNGT